MWSTNITLEGCIDEMDLNSEKITSGEDRLIVILRIMPKVNRGIIVVRGLRRAQPITGPHDIRTVIIGEYFKPLSS